MDFLNEFIMPVILGICLIVGYIIKQWVKDVDNKWIPTIVTVLGVVLSMWLNNWAITAEIILSGMVSGIASTGVHQLFKQFIENRG